MGIFAKWVPQSDAFRHAWVRAQLKAVPHGAKLLDAGCGYQPYRADCAHLKYQAQDFAAYDGKGDGQGLHNGQSWHYGKLDYIGDIWDIKAKSATFDAVLCTEVLEHIPYPVETLRELARLLKKGGVLLVTAPVDSIPHQTPYFFYHGLSRYLYQKIGAEVGLTLEHFQTYLTPAEYLLTESLRQSAELGGAGKWLLRVGLIPLWLWSLVARLNRPNEAYPCSGALVRLRKTA
jgi:2-polyprenyl-3-methyl-5-hydroxy-6-metoxy-1,4-benzoquinol methylase